MHSYFYPEILIFRSSCLKILAITAIAVSVCLLSGCVEAEPNYQFSRVSTSHLSDDKFAEPFGIVVHSGRVYYSDGHSGKIVSFAADSGEISAISGLDTPSGIAIDNKGIVYVADSGSNTVKQVGPKGELADIGGVSGQRGYADGDARSALFNGPVGIAIDEKGRIFVSDTYNDRIRLIENGTVRTVAGGKRGFADGSGESAMFDTPLGIAIWQGDKLLVADSGNRRLRVVEPDGRVWTLAGNGGIELRDGFPFEASLVSPTAVAVDTNGIIFIADGNAIRSIGLRTFPYVETIAGGQRGFLDATPRRAKFNRPSGIAAADGKIFVADSDNGRVRSIHGVKPGAVQVQSIDAQSNNFTPEEFRVLQPGRWPYDPPERPREIAGTLGEIRGEIVDQTSAAWFHNGLDIPGAYGETATFVRQEKVLDPHAAQNFGTLRELLRMPTIGYVHIRLGRGADERPFGDSRFLFTADEISKKLVNVRVPRGVKFQSGEAIGTLNAMNHVHLIAGRPGSEMNALDALVLPGVSDAIAPVIQNVEFYDDVWRPVETKKGAGRITLSGKTRIVVRAYDRMDGNAERRRLAPYRLGYAVALDELGFAGPVPWSISFEWMPPHEAVKFVYGTGSKSGASGETVFNYVVTNKVSGSTFAEDFLDLTDVMPGNYTLRISVTDRFGNVSQKDISFEVIR
ncbi:MAG TPA: hypothetical protein PKD26_10215 [Pyrinomonadaceae bacterium]|nr:hypothetical protein [Pyrinomonadaceae bacterium]